MSVGAATCEGAIDLDNIWGVGLPLLVWRNQIASIQTLLLEKMAKQAPEVSFVHTVPGVVKSGISREAQGFVLNIQLAISKLLAPWIATSPDEAGERHTFAATSARYPPAQDSARSAGVSPSSGTITTARGTNGQIGGGVYSINNKDETALPKVEELLAKFREDGTAEKVWDHLAADFKRATGKVTPL